MLSIATAMNERGRCWWVAPSFSQATTAWRELKALAGQIPGRTVREDMRRIALPGGGEIMVKSADAPASLVGEGLDLAVVDEASYIEAEVWQRALRPTLSDRQGRALIISTPNGFDWFYEAWRRGQDGAAGWASWQLPTSDNPLIAPAELAEARATLPDAIYRQEYEAQFVDMAGAVFRNIEAAAIATPQHEAVGGHSYVIGVDWGRSGDYTAFAVYDVTLAALVHLERFGDVEFPQQRGRLRALAERFRPSAIIAEANSIGQPQIEELQRDELPIIPFTTTNASKAVLVDRLALALERGAVRFIPDPILLAELRAYVGTRLPSGLMRYAARSGHDDTVMAALLALEGAATGSVRAIRPVAAGRNRWAELGGGHLTRKELE